MINRPDHITCIKQTYDTKKSWCGECITGLFTFQNIGHAQEAVAQGSRLTICPECWTAIQDKFDEGLKALRKGIGRIIRETRCDLNLTQASLAKRTNISQTIISRIECGKVNSIKHLCNICDCMNINIKISFTEKNNEDT